LLLLPSSSHGSASAQIITDLSNNLARLSLVRRISSSGGARRQSVRQSRVGVGFSHDHHDASVSSLSTPSL
jgi:hypothetical protein